MRGVRRAWFPITAPSWPGTPWVAADDPLATLRLVTEPMVDFFAAISEPFTDVDGLLDQCGVPR